MKTIISIFILMLLGTSIMSAQYINNDERYKLNMNYPIISNPTPGMDLAVIGGGVGYWMLGSKPQADKILHFWGGYFANNALQQLLNSVCVKKWVRIVIPPLIIGTLSYAKEQIDAKPDYKDFRAGISGALLSSFNYTISFEIRDRRFKKQN